MNALIQLFEVIVVLFVFLAAAIITGVLQIWFNLNWFLVGALFIFLVFYPLSLLDKLFNSKKNK